LAVTNRWTVFGPAWPPSDRPGQSKKTTLARWCRLRSYLDSAAAHGTTALDAIRSALEGKPGLPHCAPSADFNSRHPVNRHMGRCRTRGDH
jgi:hypothetical protein